MNSGYGIKEAAEFLLRKAEEGEIAVMVPVSLGNPVDGLIIYLWGREGIRVLPVPDWPEKNPRLIPDAGVPVYRTRFSRQAMGRLDVSELKRIYFIYPYSVYPGKKFLEENPEFRPEWSHLKPDGINSIRIFKRERKF